MQPDYFGNGIQLHHNIYTAEMMDELSRCRGFQWDQGNAEKNWIAHRVTQAECEQVFPGKALLVARDARHGQQEPRYYALGETDAGRRLFVVFAIRGKLVRVISARDMSRRERQVYEQAKEAEDTDV